MILGRTLRRPLLVAVLALLPLSAHAGTDGAALYKRCAACHLPTGAGVPGSFPPLDAEVAKLAQTDQGRAYLAMVVSVGLTGELKRDTASFRGFMPAQAGFTPGDVAAVLNHVLTTVVKPASDAAPFTAAEVTAFRDRHKEAKAQDVMKLRPKTAGAKVK